jgi:hypothetical protein
MDRTQDRSHPLTNGATPPVLKDPDPREEVTRLKEENRRLAVSLGGFSAFIASRGLLEAAWQYVHEIHQMEDGIG